MSAFLIYEPGAGPRLYRLPSHKIALGRSSRSHLVLPHRSVSRRHAVIEPQNGTFVLSDWGAMNAIRVNGSELSGTHVLRNNDELQLGLVLLVFHDAATLRARFATEQREPPAYAASKPASDDDVTDIVDDKTLREARSIAMAQDRAVIVTMDGSKKAWRPGRERLVFGGKDGVPVQGAGAFGLGGPFAEVTWSDVTHVIEKKSLLSPVLVNGTAIKEARSLSAGDVIRIGKSEFKYTVV